MTLYLVACDRRLKSLNKIHHKFVSRFQFSRFYEFLKRERNELYYLNFLYNFI